MLLLVPLPWWYQRLRPRIAWPALDGFGGKGRGGCIGWRWVPVLLRGLAIAALAVALARPQTVGGRTRIAGAGSRDLRGAGPEFEHEHGGFPGGVSDRGRRPKWSTCSRVDRPAGSGEGDFRAVRRGPPGGSDRPRRVCQSTRTSPVRRRSITGSWSSRRGRCVRPGPMRTARTSATRSSGRSTRSGWRRRKKKVLVLLTDGRNSPAADGRRELRWSPRPQRSWPRTSG